MLPGVQNDLMFHGPIKSWDEGLPLGNGGSGCLIWGDGRELRLSLDRVDLWETTPCKKVNREDFTYETMYRMVKEEKWDEIFDLFDSPCECPYPTKLTAGKIILNFPTTEDMNSHLSLSQALADVELKTADGDVKLKVFMHATKQAGFMLMDRVPENFAWRVEYPAYNFGEKKELLDQGRFFGDNGLTLFTYTQPETVETENTKGFYFTISENDRYGVMMRRYSTPQGELFIWDSERAADFETLREKLPSKLDALAETGFDACLDSHKAWWENYWNQSGVRLSDSMFEKNWYITQYLLASCSREGSLPMPLQGVWTADDGELPPWKGDYHHDLNTQMSYYSYLKANHLGEGKSFLDFLWDLMPAARAFAKRFYNAEGICLPAVMTVEGVPIGGWPMYAFSPTCQVWLCNMFERHYSYTGDEDFLRERAYPYMKETGRFIMCMLKEGDDGLLRLPLSSSPEIHDNLPGSWLTPNSNYDLALMRYLFTQLTELADKVCPEDKQIWSETLAKLPQLAVNDKHVYRLAPDEDLKESHRHFSHLMALYPLRLTEYETPENREIIDACVDDLELLGTGLWVGYSFCWMAQIYILQGNGEGAAAQLELFWRYFCSQNGFHLNGDYKKGGFCTWHYRPFTLEANMMAADAVQEMLLYSGKNEIRLFPAIPEHFESAEFDTFRAQHGLLVSAKMEKHAVTEVKLHAEKPCTVVLKDGASLSPVCTGLDCITEALENGDLRLTFKA